MTKRIKRLNIAKHSYKDLVSKEAKEHLSYGELAIDFTNKGLYTKLQNSKVIRIGKSIRKLTELKEYVSGSKSSKSSYTLLKLLLNSNQNLSITTAYAFISIKNISGIQINNSSLENSYINVNLNKTLSNVPKKPYQISELSDVVTNINKIQANDNSVLTTRYNQTYPGKDPFKGWYYYTWSLAPEASQIKQFDNVSYGAAQPYQVFRVYRTDEQTSLLISNTGLQIFWDIQPKLGASLNCNNKSILRQIYSVNALVLTKAIETINCDFDLYNFYNLKCTNVLVITINIKYTPNFDDQGIKYNGLIIEGFTGAIQFTGLVEYENGVAPIYTGDTNMFNILTYQDSNSIITRVLHKNLNLVGFN